MALTKSRTRTQTTLTKLAAMVANIHGELDFLEGVLAARVGNAVRTPEVWAALEARKAKLCTDRDALYATIRQFDPEIDPGRIGSAQEWQKSYGRTKLSARGLVARYLLDQSKRAAIAAL